MQEANPYLRKILLPVVRLLVPGVRKLLQAMMKLESGLGDSPEDKRRHLWRVLRKTRVYDMFTNEDEVYYSRQYWAVISKHLENLGCPKSGAYLDLGCGQGRLAIPLANWCSKDGGSVVGVDLSGPAIESARAHANGRGLTNVEFRVSDITDQLGLIRDQSIDGVVITEVVFILPEYEAVLKGAEQALRPGGVMFVAFRPLYYHALFLAAHRMWSNLDMLLKERAGRLWGDDVIYTWQTSRDVVSIIDELGMELVDMFGIGCCSGIGGDPHALLVRPSSLRPREREELMRLEVAVGREIPDAGRYMLAVAKKK